MRRLRRVAPLLTACLVILYGVWPHGHLIAESQNVPSATILVGQIKITSGDQFVSLYNNTNDEIDMATVQLAYYNYSDLTSTKLTSSRFIPLSGKLLGHSYYIVADGALKLCYKTTVFAQSLGFNVTAGTVQLTQNGPANILDSVSWSKAGSANTVLPTGVHVWGLPSAATGFLQRTWVTGITKTAADPWISVTPTVAGGCDLQAQMEAAAAVETPAAGTPAQPVTIVAPQANITAASNIGLVAPELTEVFPNPGDTQSDDTDEFIELYNPNTSEFNLADYRLEAGTSYSRGYTFEAGSLQPKSYTAFMITETNLQLSNSEGQVRLLDPSGTTITETPGYEDAPDGESWGTIADSWQWSDTPTPNATNLPTAATAAAKTTSAKTSTAKKSSGKVAGASTTTSSSDDPNSLDDAAPLHPLVLAGVGTAAVAYACYEYRKDVANSFFKLRRYLRNRRTARARL
jgi:hypothetical protein